MLRNTNTEEYICKKLLEFMNESPFVKMKVTEFVRFANISRTSFYNYFDSLDDVIQKLEDDLINGLDDVNSVDMLEIKTGKSPKLIKALEFISENLNTYRLLAGANGDPYFQIKLANCSSRIMQNWAEKLEVSELTIKR